MFSTKTKQLQKEKLTKGKTFSTCLIYNMSTPQTIDIKTLNKKCSKKN